MRVLAMTKDGAYRWMRCATCGLGLVQNVDVVSPPALPLRAPAGLKGVEAEAWAEARTCLSSGAYTAAVMMCRKLILHIAVANGLPPQNEHGKSPTFAAAVEHLEAEGVITSRMRTWVDRIRQVGNEANHELPGISKESAFDVATFTEQLLILTYEMDELMSKAAGPTATAD